MEWVDIRDLKSRAGNSVAVRSRYPLPYIVVIVCVQTLYLASSNCILLLAHNKNTFDTERYISYERKYCWN